MALIPAIARVGKLAPSGLRLQAGEHRPIREASLTSLHVARRGSGVILGQCSLALIALGYRPGRLAKRSTSPV